MVVTTTTKHLLFVKSFLGARHCAKRFMSMISYSSQQLLKVYPFFISILQDGETELRMIKNLRKWWSRNLFIVDSPPPEPNVLKYSTCFLRAVSSWSRWPLMVRYPFVVSSVCSFRNCTGELREVFYQFTMDMIERFGGTFYTYQNHQTLSNTYEYQFLNLQGQLYL